MDLLVMRERPRRGIRNSGYDVSHELTLSPNKMQLNLQKKNHHFEKVAPTLTVIDRATLCWYFFSNIR